MKNFISYANSVIDEYNSGKKDNKRKLFPIQDFKGFCDMFAEFHSENVESNSKLVTHNEKYINVGMCGEYLYIPTCKNTGYITSNFALLDNLSFSNPNSFPKFPNLYGIGNVIIKLLGHGINGTSMLEKIVNKYPPFDSSVTESDLDVLNDQLRDFMKFDNMASDKQIYFPVDDTYHVLSILYPSSLCLSYYDSILGNFPNKKFFEKLRKCKTIGDKKKIIATKPWYFNTRNFISLVFSSKSQNLGSRGKSRINLMKNLSPKIKFTTPYTDYFSFDNNRYAEIKSAVEQLDKSYRQKYISNTVDVRNRIKISLKRLFDLLFENSYQYQMLPEGWTDKTKLPDHQKKWLDSKFKKITKDDLDKIFKDMMYMILNISADKNKTYLDFITDPDLVYFRKFFDGAKNV